MPILRAGPFANATAISSIDPDFFVDEPQSPSLSAVPVNCALDFNSTTWPWRWWNNSPKKNSYDNGAVSVVESFSGIEDEGNYSAYFFYQANDDLSMSFVYNVTIDSALGGGCAASASVRVGGSQELFESDGGGTEGLTLSGSASITLPASVTPVRVFLNCSTFGGDSGTINYSIS